MGTKYRQAGECLHTNDKTPGFYADIFYSLVEAQLKCLAGVPQEGMSIAVRNVASGLSVDGRYDVSLPDALLRRLAARVHLWEE